MNLNPSHGPNLMKALSLLLIPALSLAVVACDVSGCATLAKAGPTLEAVVGRVDAQRLLDCLDAGAPKQVAVCLGARAVTEGLSIALEEASRLAEDAQLAAEGGAGAADLTPEQRDALALELDHALDRLADELDKANSL